MGFFDQIGLTRKITRPRLASFLQRYATDARTLDVGCGNDIYGHLFPNRVRLDKEQRKGIEVDIIGDAHDLHEIQDASFDVVLLSEVLEHLHTPKRAIEEMKRILKPGGLLLLTTRFIFPLHDVPGDYFRFTKYGLQHLLEGFEIVELKEEANTIETLAALCQRIGFQCETLWLRPFKIIWFLMAKIILLFSHVITREYGNISHTQEETAILCSGYYVAARVPS